VDGDREVYYNGTKVILFITDDHNNDYGCRRDADEDEDSYFLGDDDDNVDGT
jgi:hypothetical protein